MLRRDIADELYSVVYARIKAEHPEKELSNSELDSIWFTIYGRLCRGESYQSVKEYCEAVCLFMEKKPIIRGYA